MAIYSNIFLETEEFKSLMKLPVPSSVPTRVSAVSAHPPSSGHTLTRTHTHTQTTHIHTQTRAHSHLHWHTLTRLTHAGVESEEGVKVSAREGQRRPRASASTHLCPVEPDHPARAARGCGLQPPHAARSAAAFPLGGKITNSAPNTWLPPSTV